MLFRYFLVLLVSALLCSCLEKIDGFVGNYENLLVVDGLLTNENVPCEIDLSRTVKNIDMVPEPVSGANVTIEDDLGNEELFYESEPGKYLAVSAEFTGLVNRSYRLSIKTRQGEQYFSEWCELLPPSEIDSVYLVKETYRSSALERDVDGLALCLDGKGNSNGNSFYRWIYQEDWKFHVRYPDNLIVLENDTLEYRNAVNYFCWKSSRSSKVLIQSNQGLAVNEIRKKKLYSIHPADNDRLSVRYSVLVKQMSISQKEYTFWKNLAQSEQESWDLFGKQPYAIVGNVHNSNDPNEPVLGYFQVAGVASKRLYINSWEVAQMEIANYYDWTNCNLDTVLIDANNSLYEIYFENYIENKKGMVSAYYSDFTGDVLGLVFGYKKCTDCSLAGKNSPPDFWEDEERN